MAGGETIDYIDLYYNLWRNPPILLDTSVSRAHATFFIDPPLHPHCFCFLYLPLDMISLEIDLTARARFIRLYNHVPEDGHNLSTM